MLGALTAGREISRFTYSSVVLNYAEEIKSCFSKLPTFDACPNKHNVIVKRESINCTYNKRALFQSGAFNRFQHLFVESESIPCTDIFNCDTNTECILIEGEHCVGKTQLVWGLCQQWESIPALRKYQLIILLDLKDKHVHDMEGPHDLITHPSLCMQQDQMIQELCDAKGKLVLIIMDGFEQLPHVITKNHNSFIVKVIEGKILPKSTKLITTTPLVARNIVAKYNLTKIQHIELLGFRNKHTETYCEGLNQPMFQQNMMMQSLMYLPLNAAIITKFYQKCTRTDLCLTQYYSLYCLNLIWDYLKSNDPDMVQGPLNSLSDFHPCIQQKFNLLAKIALLEMLDDDDHDYSNLFTREDFSPLGLMFALPYASHKNELRFLNGMLQAFLAACYISEQEEYERDQIFFNHSLTEMSDVWKFVSGLVGLTPTVLDVLKSSINDPHSLPFIVSLLYEQHDDIITKNVFDDGPVTFSLCYPSNSPDLMYRCYSLGYCIAASDCSWNLNFSSCNVEEKDLKALICGIASLPTVSGLINSLQFNGISLTHNMLSELPLATMLHQLKSLSLNSCHLSQESFDHLARSIAFIPHLQILDIGNNNIHGNSKMLKLFNALQDLPEFKELSIENTAFDFEDIVALNKLLCMAGSTLTQLSIGGKDIALENIYLLIDTVLAQSFVETLHISDLDMTRNGDTLTLLETNTSLTRLVFFECALDLAHLAMSLCMNTTLKELEIFYPLSNAECDIGTQATVALSDMLEVNRSLSELSLYSYKPLEQRKVASLIETLNYNRTLDILQLPCHYSKHYSTSELSIIDSRVYWKTWPCISELT